MRKEKIMDLKQKLIEFKARHGDWSAHNLELAPGIFTLHPGPPDRAQQRAALYVELATTLKRKSLHGQKILDLGCLEGGISLALAKQGAHCTGVDVRSNHLVKAEFAANAMGLKNRCKWIDADVTDPMIWGRLGKFDLVICSGLLYHLDSNDLMPLLINLRKKCKAGGILIVDTNIAPYPEVGIKVSESLTLFGCYWKEHDAEASIDQRLKDGWSSLRNDKAFWLTERSLINALVSAGFDSVFKPMYPYHEWGHQTRDVWLALPNAFKPPSLPLRNDPDPRPYKHPGMS